MDHVRKEDLKEGKMLGRVASAAFGQEGIAAIPAECFVGYATFAPKYGQMKPHYHEDEYMYIVDAKDAFVTYGPTKDSMNTREALHAGEIIRAKDGEWHLFDFDSGDGFLSIIAFFGVPVGHTKEE